jgi:hypothetical protein
LVPSFGAGPGADHVAATELARTGDLLDGIGRTIYSVTFDIKRKIVAAELGILE